MSQQQSAFSDEASPEFSGKNTLVSAATPLLNAVPQIRQSATNDDMNGLRQRLVDEIRRFEIRCQRMSLPNEVTIGARYCLCTVLDEAAALTPWGSQGVWSSAGLLVTFHNETWGGEKFFQLLARLSQNPRQHIELLELINYCLLLGFEGRYRVLDNGRGQIETIRQRLCQMIRGVRGSYPPPLSIHPEDLPVARKLWRPIIPLWACIGLAGFIGCLFYIGLNWRLGDGTQPVLAKIYQTPLPEMAIQQPAAPLPPVLNLRGFLRREIQEGLVAVRDESDRSVVTLRGDGLFSSASTVVQSNYASVIDRIAQAMNNVSGQIVVVGYSDNVPIRSVLYASNYQLSLARARSVQKQLQEHLSQPSRVQAQGRGEMDPIALNDTPEHRAKNRRVEITLLVAPDSTQAELNRISQGNSGQ